MFDYDLLGQLFLLLLFLIMLVFSLYIFWPVITWLCRKNGDEDLSGQKYLKAPIPPIKRWVRISVLLSTFGVGLTVLVMLFSNETDTLLDSLVLSTILSSGLIVTISMVFPLFPRLWGKDGLAFPQKSGDPSRLKTTNIIRLQKMVFWIGMLVTAFCLVLIVLMEMFSNETRALWVTLMFALFSVMGICLILAYHNIRIVFEEDHFKYRNFWGRAHERPYDSIERYEITTQAIILYTDKKIYRFDTEIMADSNELREWIESQVGVEKKMCFRRQYGK